MPHLNTSVDIHVPIHVYNDVTKHLLRVGLHPTLLIHDLHDGAYKSNRSDFAFIYSIENQNFRILI